jgi:hypothetical protein
MKGSTKDPDQLGIYIKGIYMKGSSWDLNQLGVYMNKWNQLWIHANEKY